MFHYTFSTRCGRRWLLGSFMLVLLIGTSQASLSSEVDFSKLNNILIDLVPNNELQTNLNQAREMLPDEEAKNSCLVEPLKLLLQLDEVVRSDNKCSLESFKVVMEANKATGGVSRNELMNLRRIDKLVRELSLVHAHGCVGDYGRQVKAIKKEMDPKILKITKYYACVLDKALGHYNRWLFMSCTRIIRDVFYEDYWKLKNHEYAQVALFTIENMSKADPDAKYLKKVVDERTGRLIVDKEKLNSLYNKYLVEPCQEYIRLLGPTLVMMEQEYKLLGQEEADRYEIKVCPEPAAQDQLAKCNLLVNKDKKRLFKEMCQFVSQRDEKV